LQPETVTFCQTNSSKFPKQNADIFNYYFYYCYRFYVHALDDRDTTVGEGFFINNDHFDVHRYHPPLVYGRRGGPDDGEGIALCKFVPRAPVGGETHQFLLITYLLPILSAKAVPQMVKFVETNCGDPIQAPAEAGQ